MTNKIPQELRPVRLTNARFITSSSELRAAYAVGPFYYQYFHHDGTLSRVMLCDNDGEADWLATNIDESARVKIKYLTECEATTVLNGERVSSPEVLRRMFLKGPFNYQVRESGAVSAVNRCERAEGVELLASLLAQRHEIIVRQ
jgi:hypothetical protein